jgi:Leucine-rich repeat (LRR) protein
MASDGIRIVSGIVKVAQQARGESTTPEGDSAEALRRTNEVRTSGSSELDLSGLRLLDQLPRLEGLTNLHKLNLEETGVTDLRPLSYVTKLEDLNLWNTSVRDISPLSHLSSLVHLSLGYTKVTDLAPLAGITTLRILRLHNTQVRDVTPLSGLLNLTNLSLSETSVSSVAPLAKLQALTDLDLWKVPASDLSALAELTALRHLTLWDTALTDLSVVTEMANLRYLDIDGTAVADLSPLWKLEFLSTLYFSNTNVTSLSVLANLINLRVLGFHDTTVSDLSPLAQLTNLHALRFDSTPVSDLMPLAGLTKLQSLDLGNTRVSDLSPLVELTGLVTAARQNAPRDGLSFANCPLADQNLLRFMTMEQPARTVETIAYLRREQRLPPLSEADSERSLAEHSIPEVPPQGPGPHFVLSDNGIVTFAPPEAIDREGNNIAHLRSLHPTLRELARTLFESLGRGNIPHANLYQRAQSYLELVDQSLELVPFARLYVEGVRLQNTAAAADAKIAEGELPPFDAAVREALDSVLRLHGAFILSTADGLNLLAIEERYQRRPQEEAALREATLGFAQELQGRPDIIDPKTAKFVLNSAQEMAGGTHPERGIVVASSTSKNIAIVVAAGAAIGAIPVVAGMAAGAAGLVTGGLVALIGAEGLKKSKSFLAVAGLVTKSLDGMSEKELQAVLAEKSKILAPYVGFVLKIEPVLRRLAKDRDQFNWLTGTLDWLAAHAKRDEKAP